MGNLCGKQSPDPFAQPGRTVSSAPLPSNNNNTAPIPAGRKIGGPPRTLGGGSGGGGQTDAEREDARKKAAEAAEARANAANKVPKGKLAGRLVEQRKQTRSDTLEEASRDQRRQREVDGLQEARNFN